MPTDATLLYIVTTDRAEAERIARVLLEERLIACANIMGGSVTSFYWWEGVIRQGSECAMIVKTTTKQVDAATKKVKALHSYDCPCVVALPITGGNPDFLRWIAVETQSAS